MVAAIRPLLAAKMSNARWNQVIMTMSFGLGVVGDLRHQAERGGELRAVRQAWSKITTPDVQRARSGY